MNEANNKTRRKRIVIITLLLCCAALLFLILALNGIAIPCVFNKLTGLYCPGCGNTHAAMSLARLDFASAFKYNPLFLPEFLYIAWVYLASAGSYIKGKGFSYRPPVPALDICLLVVIVVFCIVRNVINIL